MKEYWSVTTVFDDKGKVKAMVGSTLATAKPKNSIQTLKSCDRYVDWFSTEKEARAFAAESKNA